jgi:protein arginine N-methyltransferase 1
MLADNARNQAFEKALKKVIVPGETVVADIGSGTGFLSFLASKLGAKECIGYEQGGMFAVGKALAEKNGIKNCKFIHKHSAQVKNPVKADVVVSETLGNFALEEHIIENMHDARERFLKPGGTLIPCALTQFVAPVVTDRLTRSIDTWGGIGFGLDLSLLRDRTFHNVYVRRITQADLLGGDDAVQTLDSIDFKKPNESQRELSVQWKITADHSVFGFAVWWEALLVPGVSLSTSPLAPPTHWEQIFLPLPSPLVVQSGDALLLSVTSDSRYEVGINVTWEAQVFRGGKEIASSQKMDMRRGRIE